MIREWSHAPFAYRYGMGLGRREARSEELADMFDLQISAEDDSRHRHHRLHHSYKRQGCKIVVELAGCAVLRKACKLNPYCI